MDDESVVTQLGQSAVRSFAVSERLHQSLIEHLAPAAWRAKPPGGVRTITAIFTHMHIVRIKWVRLSAAHLALPPQMHRAHCTPEIARAGLEASAACCTAMLVEALGDGNVKMFRRDGWAKPWPVGFEMVGYMLSHEAHRRDQVCMLAHQLGFPLSDDVTSRMWSWETL